jgi:hypothetical protein
LWVSAAWEHFVSWLWPWYADAGSWLLSWSAETVNTVLTAVLALGTLFLWAATKRLVRGSEQTAQRQLCAYIFPDTVVAASTGRITASFKNCRQTPAYDVVMWSKTEVAAYPFVEEPQGPTAVPTESGISLGPGMSLTYHPIPVPPVAREDLEVIKAGGELTPLRGESLTGRMSW